MAPADLRSRGWGKLGQGLNRLGLGVTVLPPRVGTDRSTIAASHTSGSQRSHGRAGLTAAAWRNMRSYRNQHSPGTSLANRATMAMYVAKGAAWWCAKWTVTDMYVANDKVQAVIEDKGNFFFFPSSFFSSHILSKAHSRDSGRRSPRSMNFPSLILATRGPGIPKSPEMGRTRVLSSRPRGSQPHCHRLCSQGPRLHRHSSS